MVDAVMKMRLIILKSVIELKLHHTGQVVHADELIRHLVIENHTPLRHKYDPHKMYKPHFTKQAKTDTDVGSFVAYVNEKAF